MDAEAVVETAVISGSGEEKERYIPKLWHRLALLVLMYLTARYLDEFPGPGGTFYIIIASAVAYTVGLRIIAARFNLKAWCVLTFDLSLVLCMSYLTGGISSLIKYFGLAYLYLISPYLGANALKAFLLGYSVIVTLFILPEYAASPAGRLPDAARLSMLNLFVLNGAGWPSVVLSDYIHRLRNLQRETSITFHSMNNALHLRAQNLKTALDALTQAHEQLKKADEKKTMLLSNVSHELRTPLSSVRSFTEILMNYEDLDRETQKEFLGIIQDETKRLNLLINDILDTVRLDEGKMPAHITRLDMAEVVRNTIKAMAPMAGEKGLYLKFDEPEGWTPYVRGDRNQMTQVLVNLINNAVKFTSRGGITLSCSKEGEQAVVGVADTGEGIFPEEKDEIFKEFYRVADNVEGRPKGSGLGLAISRKIVELHGGRIWVESELGSGSVFRFSIPLDLGGMLPEAGFGRPAPALAKRQRVKPTVLVVEENSTVRQLLRKRLEDVGYETLGAESGKSALKLALEWEPDCIISGIHDVKDNDVNLYSGLRTNARTAEVPVVLSWIMSDPEHGLQVGVNGFVQRPVDRYALTSVVDGCMGHSRGKVLVVSKDMLEARTIQLILGNHGLDVALAEPSSWRNMLNRGVPGAIILDGSLPDGSVRGIIGEVRSAQQTARTSVLLVSDAPVLDGNISAALLSHGNYRPGGESLDPVLGVLRSLFGPGSAAA